MSEFVFIMCGFFAGCAATIFCIALSKSAKPSQETIHAEVALAALKNILDIGTASMGSSYWTPSDAQARAKMAKAARAAIDDIEENQEQRRSVSPTSGSW